MSTVDKSKVCKITNKSDSEIVILSPFVKKEPDSPNTNNVYGQDIEILEFIDDSSSDIKVIGETLAKDASGDIYLDQLHYNDIEKKDEYSKLYNIIPSTSDWYYPIANIGIFQNYPPSYDPQVVDTSQEKSINEAATFYQTIAVYPTSKLAKDYQAALSGSVDAGKKAAGTSPDSGKNVATSVTQSVNDFFKSTKGFKDVTEESLVAIEGYYDNFLFVWTQKKQTITYYLYSSDGSSTKFEGTLTLEKPATIDITKPSSAYDCTFTPAKNPSDTTSVDVDSSKAMSLTYSNGLFVNDVNADIPQVALSGNFQIKSLFTQNENDNNIITVITGTVNNITVLGFDSPQKSDDPNSEYWNTLFHPKTAAQIINSIMVLGGLAMMAIMAIQIVVGIVKWAWRLYKGKQPTEIDKLSDKLDELTNKMQEQNDELFKKLTSDRVQAPQNEQDLVEQTKAQYEDLMNQTEASRLETGLEKQADSLEEMAKFEEEMTPEQRETLEDYGDAIQSAQEKLEKTLADKSLTPEQLQAEIKAQTEDLTNLTDGMKDFQTDLQGTLSKEADARISANVEASEQAVEDINASEEAREKIANDDDPKVKPIEEE